MANKLKIITPSLFVFTSFFILNSLHGMENNTCVWDTKSYEAGCAPYSLAILHTIQQQNFFLCANIFEGDGCEIITQQLKKKPCRVDSNTPGGQSQLNHPKDSIIFNDAQYDYVTLFDTAVTSKPILLTSLVRYRSYLQEQGKLLTLIQTQENEFCPEIKAFEKLYAKFFKLASPKYKETARTVRKELLPSDVDFKNSFYTKQELHTEIAKIGYKINSYQIKKYTILIKNRGSYRIYLGETVFPHFAKYFNLSKKAFLRLKREFIQEIMNSLQVDQNGNLIHPLDMTEILLSKQSPFEITIRKKDEIGKWKEI